MKSNAILPFFGASILSASLLGFASVANAATFDLTFTYSSGNSTTSSGTGSITIDDALIIPNQSIFFPGKVDGNLDGIEAFSATFIDLATTPTTTTFGLSDLNDWVFETDGDSNITDLNFESNANGDGYDLAPSDPLLITLGGNGPSTIYNINVTPAETTPEPATLLGLLAFGTVGVLTGKRKK
ncbi:MAG: PEP-CTERM sorting domain-containing protein [Microcystaceae cyanobacterium]